MIIPTCSSIQFIDTDEHPDYGCIQADITDSDGNTIDNVGGIIFDHGYGYGFSTGSWSDNTYKSLYIRVNKDSDPENHINSYISYSYRKDNTYYSFNNSTTNYDDDEDNDTKLTHITEIDNETFQLSNSDGETIDIKFNIYKVNAECPYTPAPEPEPEPEPESQPQPSLNLKVQQQ